jgi:sterol desaturase/sphingolipid hydroxylase (fatty acid hydroxylase superfamily)
MHIVDTILGSGYPYVTLAVPVFFVLIGMEVLAARWEQKRVYRFNDSINDLSCGMLQVISGTFVGVVLFFSYRTIWGYLHEANWHLLDVASLSSTGKWIAAGLLFLGVDCAYYWFHRISHVVNAPWAAHAVHHQSEEYNLTVALRQGAFQPFFSWIFYLPLALVGFPPLWFLAMTAFNTIYQFWIHTRLIGKLGPLEWVLNTPSHHRVHHGRNPKYLDKNHAGTLIIWDRLFGTFQEEEEEPVYGIVRPLASWNPVWANFHEYVELWRDAARAPYFLDKIKIWFMPPGWTPRGMPECPPTPEVAADDVVKYDTRLPLGMNLYVLLHFLLTLGLSVYVMAADDVSKWARLGPALLALFAMLVLGGIMERRHWAYLAEFARLTLTAGAVVVVLPRMAPSAGWVSVLAVVWAAVSAVWLHSNRAQFSAAARIAATTQASRTGNRAAVELQPEATPPEPHFTGSSDLVTQAE